MESSQCADRADSLAISSWRSVHSQGVVPDDLETVSKDLRAGRPTVLRVLNLHACVHVDMCTCAFFQGCFCACVCVFVHV